MTLKKEYAGCYIDRETDLKIERSCSRRRGWNVVNPRTGRILDTLPTLRKAKEIYIGITKGTDQ